ncbi:MAG: hypothetical protein KC910_02960 [Candidatus Eremiobacteraeota bacterium]|nr:hypothetical protein [Candidatus Eremiobacteraeota bacterium]
MQIGPVHRAIIRAKAPPAKNFNPHDQFVTAPDSWALRQASQAEREKAYQTLTDGLPWKLLADEPGSRLLGQTMGMLSADLASPATSQTFKRFGDLEVEAFFRQSSLPLTLSGSARDMVRYFEHLTPRPSSANLASQLRGAYDATLVRTRLLDRDPARLGQFERMLPVLGSAWSALWVVQQNLGRGQEQELIEKLGPVRPTDLTQAEAETGRLLELVPQLTASPGLEFEPDAAGLSSCAALLETYGLKTEMAPHLALWGHKYGRPGESLEQACQRLLLAHHLTGSIHGLEGLSQAEQAALMKRDLAGPEGRPPEIELAPDHLRVGDQEIAIG